MSEYEKTGKIVVSAMKTDVHPQTVSKYIKAGKSPAELQVPHTWRTRPDPLAKIWEEAVAMLRDAPELEAKTLFEHFLAMPDNGLEESHLRTFQRRVRHWHATEGPEKEVFFAQDRKPGELMQLDWTHAKELNVTIQGELLDHLLCHCVLPYSVPSRLIGHTLRVELYESQLKVYLGRDFLFCLPRQIGARGALVDFRHVIEPLLRKPGAFINYRHREALYPSAIFRAAYDRLVDDHDERPGLIEYLHVLKLAAEETVEKVEPLLSDRLARAEKWRAKDVRDQVAPPVRKIIELTDLIPSLSAYDALLGREVAHVG
jgi:hypothetical protein